MSDLNQELQKVLEGHFNTYYRDKCYPGLIFQQGKRQMLQINVPAHDLPTLLQAQPSVGNDPDSGKNRPEIKGHAEEIKEYIIDRVNNDQPWLVGTLTANVDPDKIKIIELSRGFCLVVIPRNVKLDITDGQHRKRAIHELIEGKEAELISDNDFPITLVLEKDFRQCQTDFRDMALTKQLDKSLLLSFGEFQGRVGISKILIEELPMFKNKTEKIKSNASTKKKLIYTVNIIVRFISLTLENDADHELTDYNPDKTAQTLLDCLNLFFLECSQTQYIYKNDVNYLNVEDIQAFKDNCLLGRSVGLEILGRLFYQTYDKNNQSFNLEKVQNLSQLNWSRDNPMWLGNVVIKDVNSQKQYKISMNSTAVKIAVNLVQKELNWTTPHSLL